ncbi:nitronate monooxygenase [Rhodothalassium salexigens]|uniref:NAD(P)H-dependent flavin oxidoreductase n=1 Tax=Rhodothalassium salexigens TaxID=1086 RepID=UPI0031FED02F|nr:nitronate monooxygenase [Rhodothalassium salexigens]MBK5921458.1 nitronate monooxygenase [Rhodothalassium salexigens]
MMKTLNPIRLGGREILPLIEGGKGVAVTSGASSGPWALAGGIGTVSAVNADSYDENGDVIPQIYHGRTRRERHEELVAYAIRGGIDQVRRAYEVSKGLGAININVLWEMGGAQRVLNGVLERTRELVHGVTCGAGMPYRLAEIASGYGVYYYPIVSSGRAFRALWKRAYSKFSDYLGAVVYEDPWKAGGHNGLSNAEDPTQPQDPYPRVKALRETMRAMNVPEVPIVMAGGVWYLRDWEQWIDNDELGPIAFQFGTRPLLTQESPISDAWKQKLLSLDEGDVFLHQFSPTGFYSSAVNNPFLLELQARSERQIPVAGAPEGELSVPLFDAGRKALFVSPDDKAKAEQWLAAGFTEPLKTPDDTLIFVTPDKAAEIRKDQADCMGCLSQCSFSNWADNDKNATGRKADPRSFCIQKTLQDVAHGGSVENNLVFAGHNAHNFARDPFYSNGFVPTVRQLFDRILTGN